MRLLAFVLLLAAAPAWAEWSLVSEGDTLFAYVDKATLRKRGNTVKLWVMYNWKKSKKSHSGRDYQSTVLQNEFDCSEEQSRTLTATHYSARFGGGEVVWMGNAPDASWEPLVPNSIAMRVFEVACPAP